MMPYSIERASLTDAQAILELQKLCYQSEAKLYNDYAIPPLTQSLGELEAEFLHRVFLKTSDKTRIVGSVRAYLAKGTCHIGRLIVHPDWQGQGLGTALMKHIETHFKAERYELFTGSHSEGNLRLYERLGYVGYREEALSNNVSIVFLEKLS